MRLRTAKVAITPLWVIKHPDVYGNATRMAVYAGLQVVAFEAPEVDWRSDRELATSIGEVVGIAGETCRKHLSALRRIGAVTKTAADGDLYLVQDDPGSSSGAAATQVGAAATHSPDHTSYTEKEKKEKTLALGLVDGSPRQGNQGAPKTARKRDDLFDALASACGYTYAEMTTSQKKAVGVMKNELAQVGATPAEVHRRAAAYRRAFPGARLTERALTKHWAGLGDDNENNGWQPEERSPVQPTYSSSVPDAEVWLT